MTSPSVDVRGALEATLRTAQQRLEQVRAGTDAYRLIDVESGVLPGFTVEVYGSYGVLVLYDEARLGSAQVVAEALLRLGLKGVCLKPHLKGVAASEHDAHPLCGEAAPARFSVHEQEQQLWVGLGEGTQTGLFLDQRDNRQRLRAESAGKRVLNLFCYTGSFTVAAALGGARETVSVDLSGGALRRVSDNLELNQCPPAAHRLLKGDSRNWLERAARRGDRFDWIILDPPSFARVGKGTFSVSKDYAALAQLALSLLEPEGALLAVTNHKGTGSEDFILLLEQAAAAAQRSLGSLELLPPPVDCCDATGRSSTKSVLVRALA